MLDHKPILIVEDEPLVAHIIADEIESLDGHVVGPVATVAAALALLEEQPVEAAIMDANLADRDITPVALKLLADAVPFIIYSGRGLPPGLAQERDSITLVMKPGRPAEKLAELIRRPSSEDPLF